MQNKNVDFYCIRHQNRIIWKITIINSVSYHESVSMYCGLFSCRTVALMLKKKATVPQLGGLCVIWV
jgi:hypothetical protein